MSSTKLDDLCSNFQTLSHSPSPAKLLPLWPRMLAWLEGTSSYETLKNLLVLTDSVSRHISSCLGWGSAFPIQESHWFSLYGIMLLLLNFKTEVTKRFYWSLIHLFLSTFLSTFIYYNRWQMQKIGPDLEGIRVTKSKKWNWKGRL